MTASILAIAASVFGLVVWLIKRRAQKADDPATQNQRRYQQIDRDIASGNSAKATADSSADLDELERLERLRNGPGNPGRPG